MKTINIGIDLGTSNSAIARFDGEELRIFKNKEQMETTPSVVRIDASGRMLVGKKAYDSRLSNPNNVKYEFKRIMGQSDKVAFAGVERGYSPEELSAEVLKALLDDGRRLSGEPITSAVITVPAAFGQLQCEATARAATLAGLRKVVLLQEPIAAAVAYGVKDGAEKAGHRLVYDLGGGTFDCAIISNSGGELVVVEHAGDNQCGGKDMDLAIVAKLLLPALAARYHLPDTFKEQGMLLQQALLKAAEEVKIELSSSTEAIAAIFEVGEDADGEEIALEVSLRREEVDALVLSQIKKTIDLCSQALSRAGLTPSDISAVLLVGGPTMMNIVRETLAAELGIALDYSIDPMTVVARGAAVYAASLQSGEEEGEAVREAAMLIRWAYDAVSPELTASVLCAFPEEVASEGWTAQLEATGGHWTSGWMPVEGGRLDFSARLLKGKSCEFLLSVRDAAGTPVDAAPERIQLRHGLTVANPPLPHTIGAEVYHSHKERYVVDSLFPRSTQLPCTAKATYFARHSLTPSNESGSLVIKLWEGEYEDPESNTWLGELKIFASAIQSPIPSGSEVQMEVEIDTSRRMHVHAYVPCIDQHFREEVFVPSQNEESFVERARQVRNDAGELIKQIMELQDLAYTARVTDTRNELSELKAAAESLALECTAEVSDPDRAKLLVSRYKDLRGKVQRIDYVLRVERKSNVLAGEYAEEKADVGPVVQRHGSQIECERYEALIRDGDRYLELEDGEAVRRIIKDMGDLWWNVVSRQGWYWERRFSRMESAGHRYEDAERAEELLARGRALYAEKDGMNLQPIVNALWSLLPKKHQQTAIKRSRREDPGLQK
jgi:molecular chaperone DnaK